MIDNKSYIQNNVDKRQINYPDDGFAVLQDYARHINDLYQRVLQMKTIDIGWVEKSLDRLGRHYNDMTRSFSQSAIQEIDEIYSHRQMMLHGSTDMNSAKVPRQTDNYLMKDRITGVLNDTIGHASRKKQYHDLSQLEKNNQRDKKILDDTIPTYLRMTVVLSLLGIIMSAHMRLWQISSPILLIAILVTCVTSLWKLSPQGKLNIIRVCLVASVIGDVLVAIGNFI